MKVSFQLYSARKFPPIDAQLDLLASIGFDAVEPYGGAYAADPAAFRRKLDDVGLACPTAHVAFETVNEDRAAALGLAQILSLETVVIPIVRGDERPADAAGWRRLSGRLAEHAAALAEHKLQLAWHNHDFEFARLDDGSRPIDHLAGTPGLGLEADLGWIVRSGNDPVSEIGKFAAKVVAVHMKDIAPAGTIAEDGWADLGHGVIDWRPIMPAIATTAASVLVLEHDNPEDWQRFARRSFAYLGRLLGRP